MALNSEKYYNTTIREVYQQTGALMALDTFADKNLLVRSLKSFESNYVFNWQSIIYPIFAGPKNSIYRKYSGFRSSPWAEYDVLDETYGGISGWTVTAEPWASENSLPALWDEVNKQPHSITGALYYLAKRVEDISSQTESLVEFDDSEISGSIACLENNLETIFQDVYGCNYSMDCDGEKQRTFSLSTHIAAMLSKFKNAPTVPVGSSCEKAYPSLSFDILASELTWDIFIEQALVTNLVTDLSAIRLFIGMSSSESSPTYTDYVDPLTYINDGDSLEEAIAILDDAVGNLSSLTPAESLQKLYDAGDATGLSPGQIFLTDPTVSGDPGGINLFSGDPIGNLLNSWIFSIRDLYPDAGEGQVTNLFKVGLHPIQLDTDTNGSITNFNYHSAHLYRSVLNMQSRKGVPGTRGAAHPDASLIETPNGPGNFPETAIWVSNGVDVSGYQDCQGLSLQANNLYYRQPSDGTIFKLNKCGESVLSRAEIDITVINNFGPQTLLCSVSDTNTGRVYYTTAPKIEIVQDKVGIGTSSPTQSLHLETGNDGEGILAQNLSTGAAFEAKYVSGVGYGYELKLDDNNNDTTVLLKSYGDCYFKTGGKFGIGTESPEHNLHVKPTSGNARFVLESDNNSADVEMRLDSASSERNAFISFRNSGTVVGGVGYSASDGVVKMWGDNNHNDDHLCIISSGSVGVGTATPLEKLEVSGGVKVGNSTGTNSGTIRWNGSDLEVYKGVGAGWTSLTASGGGGGGLSNIVEDSTPQLGGDLDANGNDIDMGSNVITDSAVGQWNTAYGWGDHSAAGYTSNSGTVTSVSAAADSGSGTAITTTGALTFAGGTNVTTSISGTTVTIDATVSGSTRGGGLVDFQNAINVHNSYNHFNASKFILYRSSGSSTVVKINAKKGFSVGDTLEITNTHSEVGVSVEMVGTDGNTDSNLLNNWKMPPASGDGSTSTMNTINLPSGKTISAICESVTASSGAIFVATVF